MKLFFKAKDGGSESKVTGYWLVEWKKLFSVVLLRFDKGSREAYHDHAFNAVSWVMSGELLEHTLAGNTERLKPGILPILTNRNRFHLVEGVKDTTWVLSFRGPWSKYWTEYNPANNKYTLLTHGRVALAHINGSL